MIRIRVSPSRLITTKAAPPAFITASTLSTTWELMANTRDSTAQAVAMPEGSSPGMMPTTKPTAPDLSAATLASASPAFPPRNNNPQAIAPSTTMAATAMAARAPPLKPDFDGADAAFDWIGAVAGGEGAETRAGGETGDGATSATGTAAGAVGGGATGSHSTLIFGPPLPISSTSPGASLRRFSD